MPIVAEERRKLTMQEKLMAKGSIRKAMAVTPSDTDELPWVADSIYVSTGGNIKVTFVDNQNPVTIPVLDNTQYDWAIKKIFATGTTASGIFQLGV